MRCGGSPIEFGQAVHERHLEVTLEHFDHCRDLLGAWPRSEGRTDDD